ncbi:MAG: hypothetical protein A3H98_03330 [Bacteroidetes bacterium RIFCSPLOWO2_02_FULL_36_8]|nr:MAG: hypothetical protein A3H98_03330 [Bacteroidetes bacterium RIFCSPLOWO2_02_FULL_36_8]OFY71862.1 MAG: hypothetical protein A3G23_04875 [Bacteroidetes bacterium RIFCSPLOWO2_12_FULL_37_12]
MSQPELLKKVITVLENNGIPYMLTGSVVSSLYGEPRASHDIDFIVAINQKNISKLIEAFPENLFYLNKESIKEAIETEGMFNIIDINEGDKVDFWMLTHTPFDISRFSRKRKEKFLDMYMFVQSPEDAILSKLKWSKDAGGSSKQFNDALRVFEMQVKTLDRAYLKEWAERLDVLELYTAIRDKSGGGK